MGDLSVDEAAARIRKEFKDQGFTSVITDESDARYVFGQRGKYNRLGAYIVHVALLTLFLGHFVALQTGFDADVQVMPGQRMNEIQKIEFDLDQKKRYNVTLPFSLECTDIQQRLINQDGNIDVSNTLDWRTELKITDPGYGETLAEISLNKPYTYRGFRFFQAQTIPVGNARTITLDLTPQGGGEPTRVSIPRLGNAQLPDGTKVEFADFQPDFTFGQNGQPDTKSGEYNNPVAILNVTPPTGGTATRVFAFAQKLPDGAPVGAAKAGYKWHLESFEKSPLAHVLSIKYDPYNAAFVAWYIGGFGLVLALMFVFFISHRRVWAEIPKREGGVSDIVIAGEANRNQLAFGDKFKQIVDDLQRKQ
jgi:cytochrome c biogenesis protein